MMRKPSLSWVVVVPFTAGLIGELTAGAGLIIGLGGGAAASTIFKILRRGATGLGVKTTGGLGARVLTADSVASLDGGEGSTVRGSNRIQLQQVLPFLSGV